MNKLQEFDGWFSMLDTQAMLENMHVNVEVDGVVTKCPIGEYTPDTEEVVKDAYTLIYPVCLKLGVDHFDFFNDNVSFIRKPEPVSGFTHTSVAVVMYIMTPAREIYSIFVRAVCTAKEISLDENIKDRLFTDVTASLLDGFPKTEVEYTTKVLHSTEPNVVLESNNGEVSIQRINYHVAIMTDHPDPLGDEKYKGKAKKIPIDEWDAYVKANMPADLTDSTTWMVWATKKVITQKELKITYDHFMAM